MGHLLLVESWVGAMSTLLPRAIHETGSRFSFVTRDLQHYLRAAPVDQPHPLLTADNVLRTETNDSAALLEHLDKLHPALSFDGVTTSCDYYLPIAARAAQHLGLPGPPPEAVEAACTKDITRRILREHGVPGPRYAVVGAAHELDDAARSIGFPLVVKPVDLCAGMFVRRADDPTQLREAVADIEGFPVNARGQVRRPVVLLEELLTGPEVSVETVTFGGRTTVVGITDKSIGCAPWFVETGHMFPAVLDDDTDIAETATAAIDALGLDNAVCHTEVTLTDAGPRIVEVNPRPAGNRITELVRRVTGINLAAVHAQVALGEKPDLHRVDTGAASAAISLLLPPRPGEIAEIQGTEELTAAVEWAVKPAGTQAGEPRNNNTYLGHVMTTSERPGAARDKAESLLARLHVRYSEDAS